MHRFNGEKAQCRGMNDDSFGQMIAVDLREFREVLGRGDAVALEVHHALVDEIGRNPDGHGFDPGRTSRGPKSSGGIRHSMAGYVEITESS
ncbi:MAG: hypothetical protein K0S45_2435 [Nitrospira sp.]|nr:hypothetical protein [Nitrospira sp.]